MDPLRRARAVIRWSAIGALFTAAACGSPTPTRPTAAPSVSASAAATPTPTPKPAATFTFLPAPDITWAERTSERFAYTIDYPADWVVTEATDGWPSAGWPAPDGTQVDRYGVTADATTYVTVTGDELDAGEKAGLRRTEIDSESALMCTLSGLTPIELAGASGRIVDGFCFGKDHLIDVFVGTDRRIWMLYWFSDTEVTDVQRALFHAMLASLRFGG